MKRKIISAMLSMIFLLACAVPAFGEEETEGETQREILEIQTPEEFLSFAQSCTLDTWSRNIEVRLMADICLEGQDFSPIATFGGIFDGQGHTISGLTLTESLAPTGLFRYIQSGGCIENLNLSGEVAPGGDAVSVGTFAGENRGIIQNCCFVGTVEGSMCTGGIAGVNYGTVTHCKVEGTITGKAKTGGIVGTNEGTISYCINRGAVNTAQVDPTIDVTAIDLDFSLDVSGLSNWNQQAAASDTGGIAGYSVGTIENCNNLGSIGYPSIGYNLGGVAGRNSGFIQSCQNNGTIRGRKDVGGIAGQQEPEVEKILSPDYLNTLSKQFEQLGGLVNAAGSTGAGMGSDIQSGIYSITAYLDSACSALESLLSDAEKGDFSGSSQAISDIGRAIQGMARATEAMTNTVGDGVVDLTEDIHAISSQINSISRTFALATEDAQQELVSDVSDAEIQDIREGRIYNCTNRATVEADLNVGGIVGTMALESSMDPESDFVGGSGLQMRHYEVKAVLHCNINQGPVHGKRSYCGGICGRMELGTILSCENYGSVVSADGNYVGGIAGNTAGRIRDCFAKCTVSGGKYVGGIVGNGTTQDVTGESSTVSNCYSMVDIEEATTYIGAISGGEGGNFSQNYFCSDTLAGINRVSYDSIAEPISYDALLQAEALPRQFRKLTLRFVAEGETLKEEGFFFGDSFDFSVYPDLPEKEGCYARWDVTDLTELHFDTVVTAQYFPLITALPSEEVRSDGNPVLFVQGQFQEGDTLFLQPGETAFATEGDQTVLEHWFLRIPADGQDSHRIRYLPEKENVTLYLLNNGNWIEVEAEEMGSYLAFSVPGAQVEFAVVANSFRFGRALSVLAVVAGIGLLILALRRLGRKKKWGVILILLLVIAFAGGYFLLPETRKAADTLRAYDLLKTYLDQPRQSMTLQVDGNMGTADLSFRADLERYMVGDTPVTAITEGERTLYYGKELIFLEDGTAYQISGSTPDYSRILESVAELYALVDVEAVDGVYTLTADSDHAGKLLALLMPSVHDLLDGVNTLTIDLRAGDGSLQEIRFTGAGNLADSLKTPFSLCATLIVAEPGEDILPEAVKTALETEQIQPKQVYSDDFLRLIQAWDAFQNADTLAAEVQLTADCGLLKWDENFTLHRWMVSNTAIFGIRQGESQLYFSGGKICNSQGSVTVGNQLTSLDYAVVWKLVGTALENTTFQRLDRGEVAQYQFALDQKGMGDLLAAVLPDTEILDISCESCSLTLWLDDSGLQKLSISGIGNAKIARINTDISLTMELIPSEEAAFALPESVQQALGDAS